MPWLPSLLMKFLYQGLELCISTVRLADRLNLPLFIFRKWKLDVLWSCPLSSVVVIMLDCLLIHMPRLMGASCIRNHIHLEIENKRDARPAHAYWFLGHTCTVGPTSIPQTKTCLLIGMVPNPVKFILIHLSASISSLCSSTSCYCRGLRS